MPKINKVLFASLLIILSSQTIFAGRYYDSATGRWLTVDPMTNKYPAWSPYNYVMDNPLKNIDSDGKKVKVLKQIYISIWNG